MNSHISLFKPVVATKGAMMISQGMQVRKNFRSEAMKQHQKGSRLGASLIIATQIVWGVLAAALSVATFQATAWISIPAYIAAAFFIGTRFRALSNLMHECSHYALTTDREWNNILGRLLSIPLLSSFDHFRQTHFSHHQHTGDSELDLDFLGYERFRFDEPLTRSAVVRHLLTTLTLRHVPSFVGKTLFVRSEPNVYNVLRLAYAAGVLAPLVVFGPLSIPGLIVIGYLVVPYAVTFQIINYWTDVVDHAGLFDNVDELHQTRNAVIGNPVLRAILFPRQDCFHLVHHLFPAVPVAELPTFHAKLMAMPSYAELDHDLASRFLSKPIVTGSQIQPVEESDHA
jgi:fatty acid desaturase